MYDALMLVNPSRIMNVSDLRSSISTVLDRACNGYTTHVTREGQIVAHVVPANAPVLQGSEFAVMLQATVNTWAQWLINDARASGFCQSGDPIGKVLAWLWRTDHDQAMAWTEIYWSAITEELDANDCARPPFAVLWRTLKIALKAALTNEDIRDFETYARTYLQHENSQFTLDELAGRERPRADNDPWPDTLPNPTNGWLKKRWRNVAVGEFVPNPEFAFKLGTDSEYWCRVKDLTDTGVLLEHSDTGPERDHRTTAHTLADAGSHWVPFRTQPPSRWGR